MATKKRTSNKETKKDPVLTLKEKRRAKKSRKESNFVPQTSLLR